VTERAGDPMLAWAQRRHEDMIALLGRLVDLDTPAQEKARVDEAASMVSDAAERNGATVVRLPQADVGDVLRFRWDGAPGSTRILLLAHVDTVWPVGEAGRRPFRRANGTLTGPGVFDMKAGVVQALFATMALTDAVGDARPDVRLLLTTDEETGSRASRSLIEAEARTADAVLVVEPASEGGALKTARKGIGMYEMTIRGRAAHAGIEPEKGVSAVLELAHQVEALHQLSDAARGINVTVGRVTGGTRRNVVPAEAWAEIDLRVPTSDDAKRLDLAIRRLQAKTAGASVEVSGGINRPPMERTDGVVRLFEAAVAAGRDLGIAIAESSTGGGSDGNFTAALGIPTLDGLGAVGGGAHSLDEHVIEAQVPRRTALLAGLMARLAAARLS